MAKNENQLILLGAPGSGKGTQAAILVKDEGYNHVSTGDLLRSEIKKGTDLGQRVDGILKAGQLVDDNTVLELLKANISLSTGAYIFDGYPRNIDQAVSLDKEILSNANKKVLYFKVDLNGLIERITNRRSCSSCGEIYNMVTNPPAKEGVCDKCESTDLIHRKDDTEAVIRERMAVFEKAINPMLDYYNEQGCLVEIDASLPMDKVKQEIQNVL